jgi:N-acetylmuramoyl-L-alanine amidase
LPGRTASGTRAGGASPSRAAAASQYGGDGLLEKRKALAGIIQACLTAGLRTSDRGVARNDSILLLRETEAPEVIVELAFISNRSDLELLKNADFKEKAACNIADGIAAALSAMPRG